MVRFRASRIIVPIILVLAGLCRADEHESPMAHASWPTMGTIATLSDLDPARFPARLAIAKQVMADFENRISIFKDDSEISRINQAAGWQPVKVSPETFDLLRMARHYAELSDGCFEPTVLPMVQLWGFNRGKLPTALPSTDDVRHAKERVGWQHLILTNGEAFLDKPGMSLDLGGLKGYAADVCWNRIKADGGTNFLVDLSGNMRCAGSPRPGDSWKIGVRNPFDQEGLLGVLRMPSGMAVATSGNYERFVVIEGHRYGHIMDPRNGRPMEGMAGVTVLTTTAGEADALCKPMFILGPEGSRQLRRKLPGCQVIFVPDVQPAKILITPGLKECFTPLPDYANNVVVLPELLPAD